MRIDLYISKRFTETTHGVQTKCKWYKPIRFSRLLIPKGKCPRQYIRYWIYTPFGAWFFEYARPN